MFSLYLIGSVGMLDLLEVCPMISTMAERLLTVADVAERLGVSVFTVREWLKAGRLPGFRMGGTKLGWRVREADLDRFIEQFASGGRSESERPS